MEALGKTYAVSLKMDEARENNCLEFSSVAGAVYISVDQQPFIVQRFTEFIKVWIVFDEKASSKNLDSDTLNTFGLSSADHRILKTKSKNDPKQVSNDTSESEVEIDELMINKNRKSEERVSNVEELEDGMNVTQNTNYYRSKDRYSYSSKNDPVLKDDKQSVITRIKSPVVLNQSLKNSDPNQNNMRRNCKGKLKTCQKHQPGQSSPVSCKYCFKDFKSQQEFYNHRKSRRKEHICEICQKVFPFKAHLLVHEKMHSCEDSIRGSNSTKNFDDSIQDDSSNHPERGEACKGRIKTGLVCDVCCATMASSFILKTHMMLHTGENAYVCCVCSKEFNSIGRFTHHMATHEKIGKVECKICNLSFGNRMELSNHQRIHRCRCSLCGASFPDKTSRTFHYKEYHKDDILKCHECKKLFSSDAELKSHLKYHEHRKKTQCTVCGRLVSRLNDHMLSHSNPSGTADAGVYVCDKCPKVFVKKLSFQRHLKTHSQEKPYACVHCPKQFSRSGGLSRHMLIHGQATPYLCPVCGKNFTQKGNLKTHMLVHNNDSALL